MGRHNRPNWQEKCLMTIEDLCEYECIGVERHGSGERCFPCLIYKIAHVGTASCGHKDWEQDVEALWENLTKRGD